MFLFGGGLLLTLFVILFIILLPLVALISVLINDFLPGNEKLIWVLLIIFLPFLGSVLYFVIGRNRRTFR